MYVLVFYLEVYFAIDFEANVINVLNYLVKVLRVQEGENVVVNVIKGNLLNFDILDKDVVLKLVLVENKEATAITLGICKKEEQCLNFNIII